MKCFTILLIMQVYTFCLAKDVDFRLSPICIVKNNHIKQPCAYFKERPLEKLLEESWTEQEINKMEDGQQYTNITMSFGRKNEISTLLVMIRYDDFPLPEKTWEIRPLSKEIIEFPFIITVAFAPTITNKTRYQMRRIVNTNKLLDDTACNKTETNLECKNLKNSKLFMRKTKGNSLSLTMSSEMASSSLVVEVLSAHCNITCRGDINPCSAVEIRNLNWENPLEELKIYKYTNSTEPVHYCARISPAYHECCMIYTETVLLSTDYPQRISVTFNQKIYLPEYFMVLIISLALLISATCIIRKIFGENSYKCWPYYTTSHPESVEDGLLNSIQEEMTPTKISNIPVHVVSQPVEILLIYPRESEMLEKLMIKFRYILSFYVQKIWDPLDDLEIEEVSENPSMWLENVLSRNNVKVILIEDSTTSEWYESCLRGQNTLHYHHLDSMFLYTLSVLHNNPYLCHNYRRLFIIRFSRMKINTKGTNIVPCTRYEIPRNFKSLITDLIGSYGSCAQSEFQPPLKEMEELESIICEYRRENKTYLEKSV